MEKTKLIFQPEGEANDVIGAYKNLGAAIILQAAEDYINAKRSLKGVPKSKLEARRKKRKEEDIINLGRKHKVRRSTEDQEIDRWMDTVEECEEFFLSDRFERFTDAISGEALLKTLQEKVI